MSSAAFQRENELVLDVLRIAEPAFAVDEQHRILAWNNAIERQLGIVAHDIIGARCDEALESLCGALFGNCIDCPASVHFSTNVRRRLSNEDNELPPGHPEHFFYLTTVAAYTASGEKWIVHMLHEIPMTPSKAHEAHEAHLEAPAIFSNRMPSASSTSSSKHPRPAMLTQRELEVLRLLGAGHSTADIAGELNITRVTARNHVNKVLDKLGASSRLQAVVIASQLRLI